MKAKTKRPGDFAQRAKTVDIATGEIEDHEPTPEEQGKDPAAVSLGRRGGLQGGKARAASMTAKRRAEIAKKAAEARWRKAPKYPFRHYHPSCNREGGELCHRIVVQTIGAGEVA